MTTPLACGHAPTAYTFRKDPDDGTRWTVEVCSRDTSGETHALTMLRAELVREGPIPRLVRVETRADA